ncbi:transcriptional regulator with XRE-family HTH domain [Paenibacillus endophyticus]|uniref:Transcriptional regulator with XRE-family HTH domain n=1 Tax=Paenibacillus endophyticus TaxID=1294268 RepID=A0A7W5G7L0_9BACL|nr:helix-turn-helix transcriptional regulator [Paenibacillus endophyticus]MBB3150099.1 transcriptional regulator with XRE-family HTH domain [Paenibacillus endophyticus]
MSEIAGLVGENIRQLRKKRGFSQEQLALRADINASYMGQVERGEKNPTIDVLGKIAFALQTPLEKLVDVVSLSDPSQEPLEDEYATKVVHQMNGLSLKEQEAIYRFVKQLVQFKEIQ